MENSRGTAFYPSEQPVQPATGNYQPRKTFYKRPPQPQPAYPPNESPVIPTYTSSHPARQILDNAAAAAAAAPPPAPATNGASRSSSHRRRQSQQYANPGAVTSVPEPLPAAPDVPRGPPPSSYKDPYAPRGSARSRGTSRSSSSGYREPPTVKVDPVRHTTEIHIPQRRISDTLGSPLSPTDTSALRKDSGARRPSVPDRSPLQKLEGKLDDISKEEKRARILEAELAAQEKAEAERAARRARDATRQQQRIVSGPERTSAGPNRATDNKRHVSMPSQARPRSYETDEHAMDMSEPWDPTQPVNIQQPTQYPTGDRQHDSGITSTGSQHAKPRTSYFEGAVERQPSVKGKEPVGLTRGASFRDRAGARPNDGTRVPAYAAPPTGLGLYGMNGSSHTSKRQGTSVNRSLSMSKELPPTPQDSSSSQGTRRQSRDSRGISAAQQQMEQDRQTTTQQQMGQERMGKKQGLKAAIEHQAPDPLPGDAVRNPHGPPKYQIPPQTAGGQAARDQVGFGANEQEGHKHHVSDMFHRHHDEDRRYQAPTPLDEWKNAPLAALTAEDLDLEAAERSSDTENKAWWEQSSTQRRRTSSSYAQPTYDGYADESSAPTSFNPPLYLKCGPLLRYTGIRKEKGRAGRDREIWRGSVMVVTTDVQSSYQKPPTLRLFKQPMDLLPPPPVELDADSDHLDPAYVDPLAGQMKISRSGKTLYVRPVDALAEEVDLSRTEDDTGLFEESPSAPDTNGSSTAQPKPSRIRKRDGEKMGKVREIPGIRLLAERGVTFWRFNLEVELGSHQMRIAYRINKGPPIGFWVPARGETMNIMFHSCNGFSLSVDPDKFCGPDPMWRDVLNNHQTRPFHVMIGGGDQIYNDAAMRQTTLFREWADSKNAVHKHSTPFSEEMQEELENFYLNRYAMWFSQGLFGMANSQIPMVNIWDDHDIIDGFGSYPHHFMSTAVFTGLGAVAFKYYMLFQHQSVVEETSRTEPSWVLGASPGPYINQLSRSVFLSLGRSVAFLGLDCRTERQRDEILSEDSWDLAFERCEKEIIKGDTKHLIVLLGVPIAYPRLNFLENILTSRLMDPIKALGRTGMLGGFVNKFDGGVEILDDLDDHWTAKHHKEERNWFVRELQHLAAEKSIRVTILGGDVHLAAVGQFYSSKKLGIPKDKDHRYMPNVISSAIVNTPPPEMMADILNRRNKVHHLDADTDEGMIPLFTHDVNGKKRNNNHLLPRRNWCSLREYKPGKTPPASRSPSPPGREGAPALRRTLSDRIPGGQIVRRLSKADRGPPVSYHNNPAYASAEDTTTRPRRNSFSRLMNRRASADAVPTTPGSAQSAPGPDFRNSFSANRNSVSLDPSYPPRPNPFHRRPTLSKITRRDPGYVNLEGGLDIVLNLEVSQNDPAGITTPYRLLVPALDYEAPVPEGDELVDEKARRKSRIGSVFGLLRGGGGGRKRRTVGDDGYSHSGSDSEDLGERDDTTETDVEAEREDYHVPPRTPRGLGAVPAAAIAPATRRSARPAPEPAVAHSRSVKERQPAPAPVPVPAPPPAPAPALVPSAAPVPAVAHSNSARGSTKRVSIADDITDPYANQTSHTRTNSTATRPTPTHKYARDAPLTSGHYTAPAAAQPPPQQQHSTQRRNDDYGLERVQSQKHHDGPQVSYRKMGGILNKHRDAEFEHEAHVATHTPATHPSAYDKRYHEKEKRYDEKRRGSGRYQGAGRYDDDRYEEEGEEDRYSGGSYSDTSFEVPKRKSWKFWQR